MQPICKLCDRTVGIRSYPPDDPVMAGNKPAKHHGNFEDAWGLVGRMLRSGESSAIWALVLAGVGIVAKPVDALLGKREERLLAEAGEQTGPLVFIVGAPRSGTTLAYQILAQHLEVSYFTNATALFFRSPVAGTRLLAPISRPSRTGFKSYYGNSSGLGGTNDGFSIWNRWLGEDRYQSVDDISDDAARRMRKFFAAWTRTFKKPLLNKNNRNADCVGLLAQALPQACFVEVHRDPQWVVQSLLFARKTIQGDAGRNWGLRSNDPSIACDDPVEQVCRQVQLIESRLSAATKDLAPNRYLRVDYETLCADPGAWVRQVASQFDGVEIADEAALDKLEPFSVSKESRLDEAEVARVQECLTTLRKDA